MNGKQGNISAHTNILMKSLFLQKSALTNYAPSYPHNIFKIEMYIRNSYIIAIAAVNEPHLFATSL